jgi:hypothetical protein
VTGLRDVVRQKFTDVSEAVTGFIITAMNKQLEKKQKKK